MTPSSPASTPGLQETFAMPRGVVSYRNQTRLNQGADAKRLSEALQSAAN